MKAKVKFRLNGKTINKGEDIPENMLKNAVERGYAVKASKVKNESRKA